MTKAELIREIKDEANRQAGFVDPQTDFVVKAKIAIEVIEQIDPSITVDAEW